MPSQDSQGRYVGDREAFSGATVASAARTANGNGSSFSTAGIDSLEATLVISARSGTTPTLDVVLQTSTDGGSTFYDLSPAFPQQNATTSGVGRVIAGLGEVSRWKWTVGGTTPSFTFAISATADRD